MAQDTQVVEVRRHLRVLVAKGQTLDTQRLEERLLGAVNVTGSVGDRGQVIEAHRHVRVLVAEHVAVHIQGLLQVPDGTLDLPAGIGCDAQVGQGDALAPPVAGLTGGGESPPVPGDGLPWRFVVSPAYLRVCW